MRAIRRVFFGAVVASVVVAPVASAQVETTTTAASAPVVIAVGVGELQVAPDHAVIWFAVDTEGFDAAGIARENAERVNALRQALDKQGIPVAEMQTTGYTLSNDLVYAERDPKKPKRYVARNGVRVTVRDLDRVGAVIDIAVAGGGQPC